MQEKNIDYMRPARISSLHSEKAVGAAKVAKPPLLCLSDRRIYGTYCSFQGITKKKQAFL
jgi:hypothetical protein